MLRFAVQLRAPSACARLPRPRSAHSTAYGPKGSITPPSPASVFDALAATINGGTSSPAYAASIGALLAAWVTATGASSPTAALASTPVGPEGADAYPPPNKVTWGREFGGAVGGAFGLALLVILVVLIIRCRRNSAAQSAAAAGAAAEAAPAAAAAPAEAEAPAAEAPAPASV